MIDTLRAYGAYALITKPPDDDKRGRDFSAIWLPDSANRLQRGIVVSAGSGESLGIKEELNPGDVVFFPGECSIKLNDDLVVVSLSHILAVES